MPAETMIMSTSSDSPSVNSIRSTLAVAVDLLGRFVEMHADAQRFDLLHEHARAGLVDLPRHQPRGELDDVRFQAQIEGRLGRFQAQQPAADHGAALGGLRRTR